MNAKNSSNPRHLAADARIAVVGAGISGVVISRELHKLGFAVTVFEAGERLAGKCDTFEVGGFEYNLGGHVLSRNSTIKKLAAEVGVELIAQPFGGVEQIGEFCLYDFDKGIVPRTFDLLDKLAACEDLLRHNEGLRTPGYAGCVELAAPVREWLAHNDLEELLSDFRHAYTCAGYGFVDGNLSAAYLLKYAKANDFGVLPTVTPDGGFRNLIARLAEGLDIRLGHPVLSVDREAGVLRTHAGEHAFDELIICTHRPLSFLDATPAETRLLSKVKTLPYVTMLVDVVDFPDTMLFNLVQNVSPGGIAAFARFNPRADTYNVYGYLAPGMSLDELADNVRNQFTRVGARVGDVHLLRQWDYFPHVSPRDFAEGFYEELDALQGENGTWFLGSIVAFELTSCVVEHALSFVHERIIAPTDRASTASARLPKPAREPRFSTVLEAIDFHLERRPDQRVFTSLERDASWTFRELTDAAGGVARRLQSMGLGAGDTALLIYPPDSKHFPVALFGCLLAGVVAAPVAPLTSSPGAADIERLNNIVATTRARFVLTDSAYKTMVFAQQTIAKLKSVVSSSTPRWPSLEWVRTDAIKDMAPWGEVYDATARTPGAVAYLQYTSGSASAPRAVEVTHGILAANLDAIAHDSGVGVESRFVGWVPWFHDMGLVAGFMSAAYSGAHYLFYSPLTFLKDPASWLRYIGAHEATDTAAPNFGYDLAVKRIDDDEIRGLDLSSLVHVTFGGERTRPATVRRFVDRFTAHGLRGDAIRNIYGMAENVLYITGAKRTPAIRRFDAGSLDAGRAVLAGARSGAAIELVSVGRPSETPGVSALIVDPDARTLRSDRGVGEVWIASPSTARAYHRNPVDSAATFGAMLSGDEGSAVYMRTGDLGFFCDGELYLCGRHKEVIIVAGRNIFPEDVETAVTASSEDLRPGCVVAFGVEQGDQEAVVVVAEVRNPKRGEAYLREHVIAPIRKSLAESVGVSSSSIVLVHPRTIPKTSSGKLKRRRVRLDYLAGQVSALLQTADVRREPSQGAEAPAEVGPAELVHRSAHEISGWIRAEIAERRGIASPAIDAHANLADLGIDSLTVLVFVQRLSRWLGVRVELSAFFFHPSISELSRYLSEEQSRDRSSETVRDRLIVTINPQLPGPPVYAIRPAGGSVMGYLELSERLGSPIIAVQAQSQVTHTVPRGAERETVAALAREYAELLLERGHEVEALIGFSIGGSIAYEMAKYLPDLKKIVLIEDFGWWHVDSDVEVVEVPGADHFSIMIDPHVSRVAEVIERELLGAV